MKRHLRPADRIRRALTTVAELIEDGHMVYVPIFDRLSLELEKATAADPIARARAKIMAAGMESSLT